MRTPGIFCKVFLSACLPIGLAADTAVGLDPYWRDPTLFSNRLSLNIEQVLGDEAVFKGNVNLSLGLGEAKDWVVAFELPVSEKGGGGAGVGDPKFTLGKLLDAEGRFRSGIGLELVPDIGEASLGNGATEVGLIWGGAYRVGASSRVVAPVKYSFSFDDDRGGDRVSLLEVNPAWVEELGSRVYVAGEWSNNWNLAQGSRWSTGIKVEVGYSADTWGGYVAVEVPLRPSSAPDAVLKTGISRPF